MKVLCLGLLFLLGSCSRLPAGQNSPEGRTVYSLSDVGGRFTFIRDVRTIKKKLVTRTQILMPGGNGARVLEKSVTVSQIGSIRDKDGRSLAARPTASEFTVWLEGKRYASRMQLDSQKRVLRVSLDSPEPRWQGTSEFPFPKGKYFCFFSQIPECLSRVGLLSRAKDNQKRSYDFFVIWDNYPFVQDQLTGVGKSLFSAAILKYDGELKKRFRYIIEIGEQVLLYQFNPDFGLAGLSWVSQGIMVVKPGEEPKLEEE